MWTEWHTGAVWSGSTLFVQACLSENLDTLDDRNTKVQTIEPPHDKTKEMDVRPAKT